MRQLSSSYVLDISYKINRVVAERTYPHSNHFGGVELWSESVSF